MRSLYESILSTTGSGKKAKITEKTLLDMGFKRTREGGAFEIVLFGEYYYYIYTWKDKFYIRIPRMDKGVISNTKHFVETYADLELVMDYWNTVSGKSSSVGVKQKRDIVKNTLKRF